MPATINVEAGQSIKPVDRAAVEARLVRELDGGRAALPILPHVAAQAIRFANDPNSDLRKLAELVEADPPIAARLLAVANSVIYTRAVRVSTTRLAIIRLGLEGTRDLLFQVVYASSTVGLPRYQDLVQRSFRRSVLCGLAARLVSDKLRYRFEYDYLCGLLHDIGEARIYRILANYKETLAADDLEALVDRYHRRAGAELAIAWGLPEPIIETCAHHHDDPAKASRLVKMVMMADILVNMLERRQARATAHGEPTAEASAAASTAATTPAAETPTPAATTNEGSANGSTDADGEPGPTDPGAALGPTSAIWPTSFINPPGAPERSSDTWAKDGETRAKQAHSEGQMPAVLALSAVKQPAKSAPEAPRDERDEADLAKLEALGMAHDIAESVLTKLDESMADLPL